MIQCGEKLIPLGPEVFEYLMDHLELCEFDPASLMNHGQLGPVESVFRTPEVCFEDLPGANDLYAGLQTA